MIFYLKFFLFFRISSDPLYLTPYIESGDIETGQELAKVTLPLDGLQPEEQPESFSGFITVDKNHDSNMFFWFFPAMVKKEKLK